MRWVVLAMGVIMGATTASADRADDLVIAGRELAMTGKFDEAIARFREADAVRASALHSCLVGLAQLRAGRLDEADREFAACRSRSTSEDPVPGWLAVEERKLAERRAAAPAAATPTPEPEPARRSRAPMFVVGTGVGLAAVGAAIHVGVVRPARGDLAAAPSDDEYDDRYGRYNASRIATIGLYALGGAAVAVGIVMVRRSNRGTVVGARPLDGGGLVTLEWRR